MKPKDLDQDGLEQLLAAMTPEEHEAMKAEAHAIAKRYPDLPYEIAVQLRRRELSALVMQALARVMGGVARPQ